MQCLTPILLLGGFTKKKKKKERIQNKISISEQNVAQVCSSLFT